MDTAEKERREILAGEMERVGFPGTANHVFFGTADTDSKTVSAALRAMAEAERRAFERGLAAGREEAAANADELTTAGTMLANALYNLGGQQADAELGKRCRELVNTWDEAWKRFRSPTPPLSKREGAGDTALVPKKPSPGLLMSMAIRYDHGLGVPGYYDQPIFQGGAYPVSHAKRLEGTLATMRQLHEEVVGAGFYSPEREDHYAEAARAALSKREGAEQ